MKESNFYSEEFEQLIRDKTEQYKMYPSENVWKGVHNSLHTKRKWFISSMALLVTGILYLSGKELISPSGHPATVRKMAIVGSAGTDGSATDLSKSSPAEYGARTAFAGLRQNNVSTIRHSNPLAESTGEEGPDQPYKGLTITITHPVISQPDLSEFLSHVVRLSGHAPALPGVAARGAEETAGGKPTEENQGEPGLLDSWLVRNTSENAGAHKGADAALTARTGADGTISRETAEGNGTRETADGSVSDEPTARSVLESLGARGQQRSRGQSGNTLARTKTGATGSTVGDALPDAAGASAQASTTAIGEAADRQRINWLHDYAMYTLPASARRARTFLQFTLSPMINYRTLTGADFAPSKNVQSGAVALTHPGDAQTYTSHSPALGFEFGGSFLYRVTRNLSIKGGLQFNFIRYKISAYTSSKPQQATITLNSSYGEFMDSITSMTSIGNFGGSTQVTLNNDYYQLSAPIGFELRVLGNERLQFNVGASIQPSYLLNTNSYMLTADYTNYTKEPSLFRRWNLNGGVEAFLSYETGPFRWQIGPEFRYQLYSTYSSKYPINENLKGYGLKIGVTKVLP